MWPGRNNETLKLLKTKPISLTLQGFIGLSAFEENKLDPLWKNFPQAPVINFVMTMLPTPDCVVLFKTLNYFKFCANSLKLVFSSSYAGCFLPCLLVLLFLRVGSLRLFWGMVVRGCARRDLC